MKTNQTILVGLGLLLLTNLLTGCETVTGGTQITKATINSLEPGIPYPEVINELGPPAISFDDPRVIAYQWDTKDGEMTDSPLWFFPGPNGTTVKEDLGVRYHACCLTFDDQNKLQSWYCLKYRTEAARSSGINAVAKCRKGHP